MTITARSASIAYSKKTEVINPVGHSGIDINEKNATVSANDGWSHAFGELGEVVEIKGRYRAIRAKVAQMAWRDQKKCKELLAKYGRRERNRTTRKVHEVSRNIADYATEHKFGIKMEKLKGIRRLYAKDNGQDQYYRERMNTWVFGETQRQIGYKARWDGVPTYFVNPRGTSRNCPNCGSRVAPLEHRKLYCAACDRTWDRDDLASRNIMACVVPQDLPPRGSGEGERGDDGSNPLSRWGEGQVGH